MCKSLPTARRRSRSSATEKWCCWPSPGRTAASSIAMTTPIPRARTARMLADRAIQHAAGRVDPVVAPTEYARAGSRYIDFLIPGLLGMNLMGSGIWGMGFAIVDARRKKLIKRLMATPMPRHYYLLSFLLSRLGLLVMEVGLLGVRRARVRRAAARIFCLTLRAAVRSRLALFQRARAADRIPRADH